MTVERELAQMVALAVKTATAPLLAKIAVLEARPVVSADIVDGLKETTSDLRARLLAVEARAALPGPAGPIGVAGPVGPQGTIGPAGERGERGERGETGDMGPAGKDGAAGMNGKDGANGLDGKDGAAGLNGSNGLDGKDGAPGLCGKDGSNGIDGKDGIGVMDAMLDRAGQLIVTLSNGQTKTIGVVVGKDGRDGTDGQPGRDVDPIFVQDFITKELAKWPRPKDGQDGAPGLGPDDFDWAFNADTREMTITFSRSGQVIAERTKVLDGMRIHRGVYEAGRTYEKGDSVSWDGSEWTAMAQTKDRPGNGSTPWKLTVKHGEKGARGPEGKPGRDGKDLTQLGTDGRKW